MPLKPEAGEEDLLKSFLPPGRHFVFIYPQIKKLTGAQRLILALAEAVSSLPAVPPNRVTLLTHLFSPECRAALPSSIDLIETGRNLNLSGNHYFDSLVEYGAVPLLLKKVPAGTGGICFFGPPSLPGLWWARYFRRVKIPLLYFCYEPPRAAYTDRFEITRRMGRMGKIARFFFLAYRPLDKYLATRADAVLVNGRYGQGLIQQTYKLPSTVITHGVNLQIPSHLEEERARLKERWALNNKKIILTVNHLHPRKRLDLLLLALSLTLKEHPEAAALIVGTGPEEFSLKTRARELGLKEDQVIFAGFVPENEMAACYALADLYSHTGRAESFGLSVLEASASGLPVVAVAEGGPEEIILEGETGFLVNPEAKAISEKFNRLLANSREAKLMGEKGRLRVQECYTWRKGAEAFVRAAGGV